MAKAVQFRDREQVEKAFDNMKVEAWSIWQDKQLFTKGIGKEMLDSCLDLLESSNSKAIYTLKVYEDVSEAKEIKDKTPCDGSFNFTLFDIPEGYEDGTQYGPQNRKNKLYERLGAIEERLAEREPEDEKETLGSIAMGLLKDPPQLAMMIDIGRALLGMPPMSVPYQVPQQAVGAIPGATGGDKMERLSAALDILEANDPKIVDHLEKLATIATKSPTQFKFLLKTLEAF